VARRKRILSTERRRCDRRTAARLIAQPGGPRRPSDRVLVDVEVDPGHVYRNGALREKWVFASVASKRAADVAGAFDLFAENADLSDLRHVVLRPLGHKTAIGDLDKGLKKLAEDYDRHVGRLVTKKLIVPLVCTVHIRFDVKSNLFDLHLHCAWRLVPTVLDKVLAEIHPHFSTTWIEGEKIRTPAALVNYFFTWVIDHRSLQQWPDAALHAVWKLGRHRLIRPSGPFAEFRKTLKDCRLVRENGTVMRVPVTKRVKRRQILTTTPKPGTTLGYVAVTIKRKKRWCAIAAVAPGGRLTDRQVRDILERSRLRTASVRRRYSTSTTGVTPQAGPFNAHAPSDASTSSSGPPGVSNPAGTEISRPWSSSIGAHVCNPSVRHASLQEVAIQCSATTKTVAIEHPPRGWKSLQFLKKTVIGFVAFVIRAGKFVTGAFRKNE
jgi:hypothetical protein